MFKNGLIASAIFAVSVSTAFANGGSFVPPPPPCTGAWYVGAAFSGDASEFRTSGANGSAFSEVTIPVGILPKPFFGTQNALNFDWAAWGINGQIYGGYGMVFQDHYTLDLEGFGEVDSQKGNFNRDFVVNNFLTSPTLVLPSAAHARVKQDWELGFEIKPGFKLSDSTKLYGMIGIGWAQFKATDLGFGSNVLLATHFLSPINTFPNVFGVFSGFPFSESQTRTGLILGLGMSTMIHSNIAIRGEYRWQRFGNINFSRVGQQLSIVPSLESTGIINTEIGGARIKPCMQSFSVGVSYFFHAV